MLFVLNMANKPQLHFSEPLIDYSNPEDRARVLAGDPVLPDNQRYVLISFIEGDATVLRVHGCFPTPEKAKEYHETKLSVAMRENNLPMAKYTVIREVGVWCSWPPRVDQASQVSISETNMDGELDIALAKSCYTRLQQRKRIVERVFNTEEGANTESWDALNPREREVLEKVKT